MIYWLAKKILYRVGEGLVVTDGFKERHGFECERSLWRRPGISAIFASVGT